jgi:hypothetical protein
VESRSEHSHSLRKSDKNTRSQSGPLGWVQLSASWAAWFFLGAGGVQGALSSAGCAVSTQSSTGAATYYVDATGGLDVSDGRSARNAWQTLAKVNASSFSPGDQILFKRGEIFRGQLVPPSSGTVSQPILFGAYGAGGDNPVLQGSLPLSLSFGWVTLSSPQVWRSVQTFSLDVGAVYYDANSADALTVGAKRWSAAALSLQGDFYWDQTSQQLQVYSSTHPVSLYSKGIEAAISRPVVSIVNQENLVLQGLSVRFGGGHGLQVSHSKRVTVRECDLRYLGGGDLTGDGTQTRAGSGVFSTASIEALLVERTRLAEIFGAALSVQVSEGGTQKDLLYRNNLLWNLGLAGLEVVNQSLTSGELSSLRYENNTGFQLGKGWSESLYEGTLGGMHLRLDSLPATSSVIRIRNNIFAGGKVGAWIGSPASTQWGKSGLLTLDSNLYFDLSTALVRLRTQTSPEVNQDFNSAELTAYQSYFSQDGHSQVVDPEFVSTISSSLDLSLRAGSPALAKGVLSTDVTEDYYGRPRSSTKMDQGAIQGSSAD